MNRGFLGAKLFSEKEKIIKDSL